MFSAPSNSNIYFCKADSSIVKSVLKLSPRKSKIQNCWRTKHLNSFEKFLALSSFMNDPHDYIISSYITF